MTMSDQRTAPPAGEPPQDVDDLIFCEEADHRVSQR